MKINIDIEYVTRIEDENKKLLKKNNKCIDTMIDLYNKNVELIDKNKKYKKRISNLVSQNTRLQNELFSEHLKQVETEDFIDKLKK